MTTMIISVFAAVLFLSCVLVASSAAEKKLLSPRGLRAAAAVPLVSTTRSFINLDVYAENLLQDNSFFIEDDKIISSNTNTILSVLSMRYRNGNKFAKEYFNDENVFLYIVDFSYGGNGNVMGMYFAALSCAKLIGAHFVAVRRKGVALPDQYLVSFPLKYVNPDPKTRNESLAIMNTVGNCNSNFPWQYADSGIYHNLKMVREMIAHSIKTYSDSAYGPGATSAAMHTNFSTFGESNYFTNANDNHAAFVPKSKYSDSIVKSHAETQNVFPVRPQRKEDIALFVLENRNETKKEEALTKLLFSKPPNEVHLPLIPDAAISIRCIDIISHTEQYSPYGFLNFNVYKEIIPIDVVTIYIFTEPHFHDKNSPPELICNDVLLSLLLFLDHYYPNALIAVKRAQQLDAIMAISRAPVVVCPPSTFCIWPALANPNKVYFAMSTLLASHKPIYISDNWNWISYPHIHQFGHLDLMRLKKKTHGYGAQVLLMINNLMAEGPFVSSLKDREKSSVLDEKLRKNRN